MGLREHGVDVRSKDGSAVSRLLGYREGQQLGKEAT